VTTAVEVLTWLGAALTAVAAVAVLFLRGTAEARRDLRRWLSTGVGVVVTVALVGVTGRLLVDWPSRASAGLACACVVIPTSFALGRWPRSRRLGAAVAANTLVACGLVAMVCAVYVLVVVGLGQTPEGQERTTLALSVVAAAVACLLAVPVHRRLEVSANQLVYGEQRAPEEALETFGARMSRSVPMDELMLQLVEVLRRTLALASAEIWTGAEGRLVRTVSVPHRPAGGLELAVEELPVVAAAHAQGPAWLQVWIPELLQGREEAVVRCVSVAHLGELLGLLVLERPPGGRAFTEEEDRILVDLARQVGLALHNVRLDSALQASLEELKVRNQELAASRARIVTTADESRRQIERNLHDGAQQHLVALAVKVGLARTMLDADPEAARALLGELGDDVKTTLGELRELAHGIYPPLLRDRGLGEALTMAGNRAVLPTSVVVDGAGRYDAEIEAAVYFCCLEAIQNAGKYAGEGARIAVAIGDGEGSLWFEVCDDGVGFDQRASEEGHGFVNMRDRLGAFGGRLEVRTAPGEGTAVRGELPLVGAGLVDRSDGR
jgi:signal transduction histidine kinase